MKCYPCRAGRSAGFTLVEMLIVMVLVGTAVGFSVEGMRSYREVQQSRAAATQLVTVLNLAKSRAVTMNQSVVIDFAPGGLTPSSGFYQVYVDLDRDGQHDNGEVVAANLADMTRVSGMDGYKLPGQMRFEQPQGGSYGPLGTPLASDGVSFTNDQVSFLPDGTTLEAGLLTVSGDLGHTYGVTLTAGGAVRTYRYGGGQWR